MATALYRRYRPETFSEMIGQTQVTEPLMTALRAERIGHAYLFSGPRGCGKTTSARILARCLNCAEGPTDTPCGSCPSCVELSREGGGSLDVVEIDAASHGGVDDARELRERAVFAPARDRFKIFIIDEAHMVTSGGFNALLKIVEEPPPHVKFIFATTEPDKVIGTIRSRTHHYPFRLIAPGTLIDYAQQLCASEGIEVEPGVMPLVVRAGGGSVRDTLSILDQLIAGSEGSTVALERATGLLGFTSGELLDEVVTAFGAGDAAAAFAATDRVVQTGQDPRRFVEDLLERLRDLIVVSATSVQGSTAVFRGMAEDQLQRMFEQAQTFPRGLLSRLADTVSEALDRMTGATAPRLQLELMIARSLVVVQRAKSAAGEAARPAQIPGPEQSAAPVPSVTAETAATAPAATAPVSAATESAAKVSVAAAPASAPTESAATKVNSATSASSAASASPASPASPANSGGDDVIAALRSARDFLENESANPEGKALDPVGLDELMELWPDLLQELLENNRDAWNAVKAIRPLALDDGLLTVGISTRSDLERFKVAGSGPLREAIEAALGITVKYLPKELPAAASVDPTRDVAEPREPELSEPPAPAWADPPAPEPDSAPAPDEPGTTDPEPGPVSEPKVEPASEPATTSEETPEATPNSAPAPEAVAQPQMPEPVTGRYGEAVVREVLSATFVEERPLPSSEG